MIRLAGLIVLYALGFALVIVGMWFTVQAAVTPPSPPSLLDLFRKPSPPSLEYKDFVSILLTALGVMIALGAFFVAVVAVWGYNEAKKLLSSTASEAAARAVTPEVVVEALKQDPSLLISAAREAKDVLFGDIDANEADEIVGALDDGDQSGEPSRDDQGVSARSAGQSREAY